MNRQQRLSVRRTPDFDADLALLQGSGVTASDAVRHAVRSWRKRTGTPTIGRRRTAVGGAVHSDP
ncbi:hypothetical protein [Streptomyces sp. NPDC002758]